MRVLDYDCLKNLVAVASAVAFFAATGLSEGLRRLVLVQHVTRLAKPSFGYLDDHYCALANGIDARLTPCAQGPRLQSPPLQIHQGRKLLYPFNP